MLDLDPAHACRHSVSAFEDWMAKPKVDDLHTMLPIDSIVSVYDELSQPLPSPFPITEFMIRALRIYLEEGKRLKKELQNGLGFMIESIASLEIGTEAKAPSIWRSACIFVFLFCSMQCFA